MRQIQMSFEVLIQLIRYIEILLIFCIIGTQQDINQLQSTRAQSFSVRYRGRKICDNLLRYPYCQKKQFYINKGQLIIISLQKYRQISFIIMAYAVKSNWGLFSNPQQARLQAQIQSETAALLNQRNMLKNPQVTNQNWPLPSKVHAQQNSRIISKVQQIINLCQNQNNFSNSQMSNIVNAQKQILNLLLKKNKKTHQNKNLQATFQNNSNQNGLYSVPQNQAQDPQNSQFRSNIRQKIQQNPKITVSDDLIGMIEQIQSKALTQIQKLRQQKISLMKQLKLQIQQNNNLQRQIINFAPNRHQSKNETPFKQYRQSDVHQKFDISADNLGKIQQFKAYIAYLQSELQRKDSIIKQVGVSSSFNNSGQINQLLEQGENIRQNTIHLIRLKQAQTNGSSKNQLSHRVKELEQLLQKQEEEKANFFNDLLAFKQRYQSLQLENKQLKRQSKTIGTLGTSFNNETKLYGNSSRNQFIGGNSGLDQYQRVLSRMRNARN